MDHSKREHLIREPSHDPTDYMGNRVDSSYPRQARERYAPMDFVSCQHFSPCCLIKRDLMWDPQIRSPSSNTAYLFRKDQ